MRKTLIAGNWKMNGLGADGVALARAVADGAHDVAAGLLVCPPATLIARVAAALAGTAIGVGGQDCHDRADGAFTGDVSAEMLADAGARAVILGHSERRHGLGETDEWIKAKVAAAWRAGLTAIVCVGETEAERDGGQAFGVVGAQVFNSIPEKGPSPDNLVVAYEPVWAIGTGRVPDLDDIQTMHKHIRSLLAATWSEDLAAGTRVLYGGSMKPGNAGDILDLADVDGGLIGGASLKAEDFLAIARARP